ncbi:MAG: hypothetical protein HZA37_02025 [Parcubacteria group bacterium]|nr:hypothetical protein [Parcubacteria group bacterium]
MFLSLISAVLGILAFPPSNFSFLALVFLVPYFVFLIREDRPLRLLAGSFLFQSVYGLGLTYFLIEPLLYLSKILIFLILPFFVIGIKKIFLWRERGINLFRFGDIVIATVAVSVGYLVVDYLSAKYALMPAYIIFSGNAAGASFLGLAKYGGLFALGAFVVFVNGIFTLAYFEYFNFKWRLAYGKNFIITVLVGLFAVSAGVAVSRSALTERAREYAFRGRVLNVAVVSVSRKFDAELSDFPRVLSLERLGRASDIIGGKIAVLKKQLGNERFDLVILPEGLLDAEILNNADAEALSKFGVSNNGILISAFSRLAKELGADLLTDFTTVRAGPASDGAGKRYNSAVLFGADGSIAGIYDKNGLAYGGEYWPFGDWRPFYFNWLRSRMSPFSPIMDDRYNYAAGTERKILEIKNGARFGTLICLEAHLPRRASELAAAGADFLVNPSSNLWLKKGVNRYLGLSTNLRRITAVSSGLPVVVSGRQDWAGVIFPDGTAELVDFQNPLDYGVFKGPIRF